MKTSLSFYDGMPIPPSPKERKVESAVESSTNLPEDIWRAIFGEIQGRNNEHSPTYRLTAISSVCTLWKRICNRMLLGEIATRGLPFEYQFPAMGLSGETYCSIYPTSFKDRIYYLSDSAKAFFAGYGSEINSLNLKGCYLLPDWQWISICCSKLQNLKCHNIGIDGMKNLSAFSSLKHLDVLGKVSGEVCDSSSFVNLTALESLKVRNINLLTCEDLGIVFSHGQLKHLELVNLNSEPFVDVVRSKISKLTNLEHLRLERSSNMVEASGLQAIAACTNLTCLNVSFSLLGSGLQYLTSLVNLKDLNLSNCESISELQHFKSFTKLEKLNLFHCRFGDDVTSISLLTNLNDLEAGSRDVDDKFLMMVSSLTNLRRLKLGECGSFSNLQPLSSLTNLNYLHLRNTNVRNSSLTALSVLVNLEALDLINCCGIENESLKSLSSLEKLKAYCM